MGIAKIFQGGSGFTINLWNGVSDGENTPTVSINGWSQRNHEWVGAAYMTSRCHSDSFRKTVRELVVRVGLSLDAVCKHCGQPLANYFNLNALPFDAFDNYLTRVAELAAPMQTSENHRHPAVGRGVGPVFNIEINFNGSGQSRRNVALYVTNLLPYYRDDSINGLIKSIRFKSSNPDIVKALKDVLGQLERWVETHSCRRCPECGQLVACHR